MVGESRLMAFYRGGRDDRGRRLEDVLGWDHHQLELVHDYIQWMFPLTERSMAQPSAPVLSADGPGGNPPGTTVQAFTPVCLRRRGRHGFDVSGELQVACRVPAAS